MKASIVQKLIRVLLFFILYTFIHWNSSFAQKLNPVSYPVGFQTLLGKEGGHHTVMHLWYPSNQNVSPSFFSIQSYLQSFRNVIQVNQAPDSVRKTIEALLDGYGVDSGKQDVVLRKFESLRDTVYVNAKPLTQTFPIVVINSALNNEAIFHTHMAHFLASKGYVVVALGSGVGQGIPALQYDTSSIQRQVKDIEVAIKTIRTQMKRSVNMGKTALISWSTGGIAAWRFAEMTAVPKVLISLDAAMGYAYGLDLYRQLGKYSKTLDPSIHVLHFKAKKGSVQQDVSILQSSGNDRIEFIELPELNHYHLTSLANLMNQSFKNNSSITSSYKMMLKKIHLFLLNNLKD